MGKRGKKKRGKKRGGGLFRLRWLLVLVLAVCAADGLWFFHQGGDWHGLPGHYEERFAQGRMAYGQARAWWQKTGQPQAQRTLDSLAAAWDALQERVETAGAADAPLNPPSGSDALRCWFGPAPPNAPGGIDDAFLALAGNADQSIAAALYDIESEAVANALIERHRAGVDVRLVSDSDYKDRPAAQRCIEAGIPIVWDGRSAFMHNKFCIIDGETVWTGSTNLTDNGFFRNNNNALRIASPEIAAVFEEEFTEMFTRGVFGGGSATGRQRGPYTLGSAEVVCYFSPDDSPRTALVALIRQTRTALDFMAFSFTSEQMAEAMAARIDAGVRVRGLFEKRNAGSRYSRDDYLENRGAEIYMDTNPQTMHHKVIILDRGVVVTGSYNFSNAAEERNDENLVLLRDAALAAAYTAEFERLIR